MSTTINTGWLKDNNGDKFAPKTLTSQVQTSDGILLENKIETDILSAKDEMQEYTDSIASGKANTSHSHSISDVSNLQSTLDSKQATITGGATTITSSNLTTGRALISDSNGKVAVSAVTSTELGYLDGVTSAIQTQFDSLNNSLNNKCRFYTIDYGNQIGFRWADGRIIPTIDTTEFGALAYQDDLTFSLSGSTLYITTS